LHEYSNCGDRAYRGNREKECHRDEPEFRPHVRIFNITKKGCILATAGHLTNDPPPDKICGYNRKGYGYTWQEPAIVCVIKHVRQHLALLFCQVGFEQESLAKDSEIKAEWFCSYD
jgi:hypothetical protein